jgi:SIR2-like domain
LPGSAGLAEFLLTKCDDEGSGYDGDSGHLRGVVDHLVSVGCDEEDLLKIAAAEIATWVPERSELIETLIRVPSRFIVTFNFDPNLEDAASAAGLEPVVLGNTREDLSAAIGILLAAEPPPRLTILHLHGSVADPSRMVLGEAGYKRIEAEPFSQLLRELAVRKTLFFFGTKLDEFYILAELQKIEHRNSHVLWCLEAEKAELTGARGPILHSSSGIYVRTVAHHEDLPAKAALLLSGPIPPSDPETVPAVETDEALYVANELRDRRNPTDQEDLVRVSFGLKSEREIKPNPTEDDVLQSSRTIVLGDPGSGKTTLLLALMRRTKAPRRGLFIRLTEVEVGAKLGPRETLALWARHGVSADGGLDVSASALAEGSYHLFLDGLDEVATELQEQLAKEISDLAQELPRHSFTVSTRPLPSLELLQVESHEALEWNQFTLEPGPGWRDRFLSAREASLDALYEEMPALEDMADVLTTPFYLSNIVDLHENEELKGLHDFGQILARLIDLAIAREQGALGLDNYAIRAWLQRIALAGVIAGRRTVTGEELRSFDLPSGSEPDAVALARVMEQRLLLAEDRGSFRFHHRLLGEQLAAEALIASGPLPELLDCLVPYVDDALSGVRPDVVVPVGLACMGSEDWRRAVAARDPLAAARATPADVPGSEREAALRVLWDNATARQVWVWERGMRLTDDADAMGRLMREAPDSAIAAEIRSAVDDGTDQDQGNAIRVLSRADTGGFEAMLKGVLADPDRNGVVLRQAVIAAADRGFVDLAEDIVEMLVGQVDSAVHQGGLIGLRQLLGDQHRMDLYLRLMAGPEADYLVATVLDDLDPGDGVLLLAEYARHANDLDPYWSKEKLPVLFGRLDLDQSTPEILAAAVDVAVLFELEGDELDPLRGAASATVADRLSALFTERGLQWWQAMNLAIGFEPEQLETAGLPEEVVNAVRVRREAEAARAATAESPRPAINTPNGAGDDEQEEPPPTLGDLLDRDQTDVAILNNSRYFARSVVDLSEAQLIELHARLARWWPTKPLLDTITWTAPNSLSQEAKAAAWVWLGPAARPQISAEQWAELATCGILFEEQRSWLAETQTLEGIYRAVDLLGEEGDVDLWEQFLSCCADPLPNRALVACARYLDPEEKLDSETIPYRLRTIAGRLIDNDRADLARQLARRSARFAEELTPRLAAAGDSAAQQQMLSTLIKILDRGELPDEPRLVWLPGSPSPSLLDDLFEVLRRSFKTSDQPVQGVTVGFDLDDVARPTMEAIAAIGSRAAVAKYDDLIACGGDLRWLSHQRDQLAATALASDGARFANIAARRAGLPLMGELEGVQPAT